MIGVARPASRIAWPMSWMKIVGEWVGRIPSGLSVPRGDTAPPSTVTDGAAFLIASYARVSRRTYAGAAASVPSSVYCGSQ